MEKWRPVVGYEGWYEVSDLGRVRGLERQDWRGHLIRGQVLSPYPTRGYPTVNLKMNGQRSARRVHSLVMAAFVGPLPAGLETRHLDGDRTNAALANLAYGTHLENAADTRRHGTHNNGRKRVCKRGHPFTPQNTRVYRGRRVCRACEAARSSLRRAA